jgi:hypothetical protein
MNWKFWKKIEPVNQAVEEKIPDKVITEFKNKHISDTLTDEKFACHYCHKEFMLQSKNIFPVSVRLLYKDSYVTGKGTICPYCQQVNVTG